MNRFFFFWSIIVLVHTDAAADSFGFVVQYQIFLKRDAFLIFCRETNS